MMKKVYICAPLGGDVKGNIENAIRYTEYALKCGTAPIVPHFFALCLNDNIPKEREMGKSAGLGLLWFADELWIFGNEITAGMEAEIRFCKALNIKIKNIRDYDITKMIGGKPK